MIHNNKDYTGSVYGGLGHLLYTYCLTLNLPISPLLNSVQNLERFPYTTWYELLQEIENSLCTRQISQNPYPIRILPS